MGQPTNSPCPTPTLMLDLVFHLSFDIPTIGPPELPIPPRTLLTSNEEPPIDRQWEWEAIGQHLKPAVAWMWPVTGGRVWCGMGIKKTERGYKMYTAVQEYLERDRYTVVYLVHIISHPEYLWTANYAFLLVPLV